MELDITICFPAWILSFYAALSVGAGLLIGYIKWGMGDGE